VGAKLCKPGEPYRTFAEAGDYLSGNRLLGIETARRTWEDSEG